MAEKLLSVSQVAEQFGVDPNWIHSHATGKRQPVLPSLKVGKYRRFRQGDIDTFLLRCAAIASDMAARKNRPRRVA